jgi:peptidoglycan hydrolase-like protein with peptidoglycan-binding domain
MSRAISALVVLVLVGVAAVAGWWAASVALAPPEDPLEGQTPTEIPYEVGIETIQRELRFDALAEWTTVDGPANRAAGTITGVAVGPGDTVAAGDLLYAVDLRPVVVAEGATPMFRDLRLEVEGPDVAQLQSLLGDLGFFEGGADGVFAASTRRAVQAWQESLGLDTTGVVGVGDVVFLEDLPRPILPGEGIVTGRVVTGGEEALRLLPDAPRFWIPLSPDQRTLVPSDSPVVVEYPAGSWDAVVAEVVDATQAFGIEYVLTGSDGRPLCGDECTSFVPVTGTADFEARVVVIPETTGPGIPVAAIRTGANGTPYVRLDSGQERPVSILESTGGTAIVAGVDAGDMVLLSVTND